MIQHVTFIIFQVTCMQDDSFAHLQHVILFHVRNYTIRNFAHFPNNTTCNITYFSNNTTRNFSSFPDNTTYTHLRNMTKTSVKTLNCRRSSKHKVLNIYLL